MPEYARYDFVRRRVIGGKLDGMSIRSISHVKTMRAPYKDGVRSLVDVYALDGDDWRYDGTTEGRPVKGTGTGK